MNFLNIKQLKASIGLSRSTIYNNVRNGTFPKPVKLSPGRVAWEKDEVDAWVQARIVESQGVCNG